MTKNDVVRSLRYILNVNDQKIGHIIGLGGTDIEVKDVTDLLRSEEDPGYLEIDDLTMIHFLDGLIYHLRGKDESKPPPPAELPVTHNLILKKLRVAFQLKEEDVMDIFEKAEFKIGRAEVSAFLRKKDHPNYRPCGDQVLRNFLKGLRIRAKR